MFQNKTRFLDLAIKDYIEAINNIEKFIIISELDFSNNFCIIDEEVQNDAVYFFIREKDTENYRFEISFRSNFCFKEEVSVSVSEYVYSDKYIQGQIETELKNEQDYEFDLDLIDHDQLKAFRDYVRFLQKA